MISGYVLIDTVNNVVCPKCMATKGERCRTPSGRRSKVPHSERFAFFTTTKEYIECLKIAGSLG